jgi:hypothetical protein
MPAIFAWRRNVTNLTADAEGRAESSAPRSRLPSRPDPLRLRISWREVDANTMVAVLFVSPRTLTTAGR